MSFGSLPSVLGNGGGVAISVIGGTGLFADGTAAAPSISFANSTNMGFFRYGPNDLGVSVLGATSFIIGSGGTLYGANGTARLTLPASGSVGLVAAGTNQNITLTPSGSGQVQVGDGTYGGQLTIKASVANTGTAAISLFSTGNVDLQIRNSGSNLAFFRDTTEFARFNASNRFLLGTTTDSGNGILQLATHTTSAGGIGFGTDISAFRATNSILSFVGGQTSFQINLAGSASTAVFGTNATGAFINSAGSTSLVLQTNTTTALTLDASQNATFAGTIFAKKSAGTAVFALDTTSGSDLTIANNAVAYPFSNANNFAGLIVVTDTSNTGNSAVFLTSASTMILVSQTGSSFSNTSGTAAKTNFYISGGVVVIENKSGAPTNYSVQAHRTRTTS